MHFNHLSICGDTISESNFSFYSTCKLHFYHHPGEVNLFLNIITDYQKSESVNVVTCEEGIDYICFIMTQINVMREGTADVVAPRTQSQLLAILILNVNSI